jgi:hypothetical protein
METENITLKPIPPKIINCSACQKTFVSTLRLNCKFFSPVMNAGTNQESKGQDLEVHINN